MASLTLTIAYTPMRVQMCIRDSLCRGELQPEIGGGLECLVLQVTGADDRQRGGPVSYTHLFLVRPVVLRAYVTVESTVIEVCQAVFEVGRLLAQP